MKKLLLLLMFVPSLLFAAAPSVIKHKGLSSMLSTQFLDEVQFGRIPGVSVVHKFGHNTDVGVAMEDVWSLGNTLTFATTNFPVIAVSTSTDDDIGGSGAQKIKVQGLDLNWNAIEQEIAMNGTSSTLAATINYMRVFRAYVSETGTYATTANGGNAGTITVTGSGENKAEIEVISGVGQGQTQIAAYTVPASKVAYVYSITVQVDGTKGANIYFWQRQDADDITAPFASRRIVIDFPAVIGRASLSPRTPLGPFPHHTDIWFSAIRSGAQNSGVTVDFEILLIDD